MSLFSAKSDPLSPQPSDTSSRFAAGVIRRRWPIMLLSLLATLFLAIGGQDLGFSTDYRVYFGDDNPQLQAFENIQSIYSKNDYVLFAIAPDSGEIFSHRTLELISRLTDAAWQMPHSQRVDSVTNFQHTYAQEDDLIVEDLIHEPAELDEDGLRQARRIALAEPLLVNALLSPNADAGAVAVNLEVPDNDENAVMEAVVFARDLRRQLLLDYPDHHIALSGTALMNAAFAEAALNDMATLVPLMYIGILLLMVILLRSFWATVGTVLVIGMSAASAMGFAGWAGIPLTTLSVLAPTMILTVAVADSVHLLVHLLERMRQGDSKKKAVMKSLRLNLMPIFITSLTTAIGFASMNLSDSPPLGHLGTIVTVGVIAAFVHSVFFLPAFMSLVPLTISRQQQVSRSRLSPALDRLGAWVVAHNKKLIVIAPLIAVLLVAFIPANELDDNFVEYFDDSIEFRRDTDFVLERLTGIYQLEYSLGSGDSGGIADPGYLAEVAGFRDWMLEQPGVVHVATLATTMERLNMNMHGDDPAFHRLPDSRELSAQYLLLYEMSLPFGLDLNNQINVDKSATRFVATLRGLSAGEMRELSARSEEWLRNHARPAMFSHAAGATLMFAHISDRNIRSMIGGTALAFGLITLVLIFALRRLSLGLLSLIPNVTPALVAFGVWGLTVGQVGFAVSVVVAMTLGLVVDDTVHFLSKYERARRQLGMSAAAAIRYAFRTVGVALTVTSAVLTTGFLVLAQSPFAQNGQMGQLTAITIVLALLADFFLLPPLLMVFDRRRDAATDEPQVSSGLPHAAGG